MISVGHESKIPKELALNPFQFVNVCLLIGRPDCGTVCKQWKDERLIQINDKISMFKVVSRSCDESKCPNGPIVNCLEMVTKGKVLIEYNTKILDGRDTVDSCVTNIVCKVNS